MVKSGDDSLLANKSMIVSFKPHRLLPARGARKRVGDKSVGEIGASIKTTGAAESCWTSARVAMSRSSLPARISPDAPLLAICVALAFTLRIFRRLPFSVTVTVAFAASRIAELTVRSLRGRPFGLPLLPFEKCPRSVRSTSDMTRLQYG